MSNRTNLDADRNDVSEPRSFGRPKPDGRRFTRGVTSNGGKQLVLRALKDVPEIGVVRNRGYVLVGRTTLPRNGQVSIARRNAMDKATHFTAPASLFSVDWRGQLDSTEEVPAGSQPARIARKNGVEEASPPTAAEYQGALSALPISEPVRRTLEKLYQSSDRGASLAELAQHAGQASARNARPTLGGFGGLLRSALVRPAGKGERVSAILASEHPETGRLVIVPALAKAISGLGWFVPPDSPVEAEAPIGASPHHERDWLEALGASVRSGLMKGPLASKLRPLGPKAEETDPSSDGFLCGIVVLANKNIPFYIFIDSSMGETRRSVWYGTSADTKESILEIEAAGRSRWPYTQLALEGQRLTSAFRFEDPWIQHYRRGEHYYGWQVSEEPNTLLPPTAGLVHRISEHFASLISVLAELDPRSDLEALQLLDGYRTALVRLEQGFIRRKLFGARASAPCALCGTTYDVSLLVAAHIKRRAEASDDERRSVKDNVMPLCALGCDALFERGYLVVRSGKIAKGPKEAASKAARDRVTALVGRACEAWTADNDHFFKAHRNRHES